ncbi:hypothetical protein B7486_16550 [cyanobacterium TDX16]|nr:hypothetical protein B7486_16550 [cyanobacterium TDX16]
MSVAADQDSAMPTALLAVSTKRLAELLDMSPRSVDRMDAAGQLPTPIYCGSSKRFILDGPRGVRAWLEAGCPKREDFEGPTALSMVNG